MSKGFPSNFTWGAGTSAYQIEGAARQDGKGPSIWDKFTHDPGRIADGSNGDIACDHYNRFEEDVELMKELGINAYRFSIAWTRILPDGRGQVEPRGLDFYDRLIDKLLESDITPWVTLYHWDLPQALEDRGGWPNRQTADHFVNYTDIVSRQFGDRVKNWITINEPWVAGFIGYYDGSHAPGRKSLKDGLSAVHTLLLAHGQATNVIRENTPDAKIGIALNLIPVYPATESAEDKAAAVRQDGYQNRWFLDPLYKGKYPEDMLDLSSQDMPEIKDTDMQTISSRTDFLGVNYYLPFFAKNNPNNLPLQTEEIDRPDLDHTDMGWLVYPDGLYDILRRLVNDYSVENLYVTENGAATREEISPDGRILDPKRIEYIEKHLDACHRAIQANLGLKGYFAWSLMDNFEWAEGYKMRFGLIRVDFDTQERTIKESGRRYKQIISNNAI